MNWKNFLEKKMPNLEVTIFNQKLKLSYQDDEKQRLIHAVETLNNNWNKFSDLHGKVSDLKIITLMSLELQDSLVDMQVQKDQINQSNDRIESLKKEIKVNNKELKDNLETIKKLGLELDKYNKEMIKTENILDELHEELLQIKNKLLKKTHE